MVSDSAPRFTIKPQIKQEGDKLVFHCQVEASPQPDISWSKGTANVVSSDRLNLTVDKNGTNKYDLKLVINNVQGSDEGSYKVTAKNRLGEVQATVNLNFGGAQQSGDGLAPSFTQKPSIKQEDKRLVFECRISATPEPVITWSKDGVTIKDGGRYMVYTDPETPGNYVACLEVFDVEPGDGGNYKVNARNDLGESNANIKVNFDQTMAGPKGSPPKFTQKPAIKQVGNNIVFECKLTGDPKPKITWYAAGGKVLQEGARHKITEKSEGGNTYALMLEIIDVGAGDGGEYKVNARNDSGESNATINLNFEGTDKKDGKAPKFTQKPVIKQEKDKLVMSCQVEAKPKPDVTWFKGTDLVKSGGRVTIKADNAGTDIYTLILEIKDPKPEDGGSYKCTAKNSFGESNANIALNFQDLKKDEKKDEKKEAKKDEKKEPKKDEKKEVTQKPGGSAPTFTTDPVISQDRTGKNVTIEAKLTATPKPTVIWFKDGTQIKDSKNIKIKTFPQGKGAYLSAMEITGVKKVDGGEYKLVAKNANGEAAAEIELDLDVLGDPQSILKEPKIIFKGVPNIRAEANNTRIIIEVKAQSKTKPKIEWEFNKAKIQDGGRYFVDVARERSDWLLILEIDNVSNKDEGTYKVNAKNTTGKKWTEVIVDVAALTPKVEEKKIASPEIVKKLEPQTVMDGDPVDFVCNIIGDDLDIIWTKNGKEIKSGGDIKISRNDTTKECRLHIVEVFPEDAGMYKCEAWNDSGDAQTSANLNVKVQKKPEKKPVEEEITPKKDSVDQSAPIPDIEITEAKPGEQKPGEEVDESLYETEGPKRKQKVKGPVPGPTVADKPKNQVVTEGDTMFVDMKYEGGPFGAIRWFKGNRELKPDARTEINLDKSRKTASLKIKKCKFPDEGKFAVALENDKGQESDRAGFTVFIKDPKDSSLDFRALLKHRDVKKTEFEDEDDDLDYNLKPGEVDDFVPPMLTRKTSVGSDKDKHKLKSVKKEEAADVGSDEEKSIDMGRRGSTADPSLKKVGDSLDPKRRSSKDRRVSLAEVIPDWPTLQHHQKKEKEPDTFIVPLKDIKCKEGDKKIEFFCQFCKSNAKLRWYKNKLEIFQGPRYDFVSNKDEQRLIIKKIKLEDGGKYTCKCDDTQTSAWLYVEEKKAEYYFTQKLPETVSVVRKKKVTLECALIDPRPHVIWYKNGERLDYTPKKYEIVRRENRCLLTIVNADDNDVAEYKCEVEGDETTTKVLLQEPSWGFSELLHDEDALENEDAEMYCEVNDADAEVQWFKGAESERPLENCPKYEIIEDGVKRILKVKNMSKQDEHQYICRTGQETTQAKLFVEPDVKFKEKLKDVRGVEGQKAVMECRPYNPHRYPVSWFKDGKEVTLSDRVQAVKDVDWEKLVFETLDLDDEALYTCKVGDRETKAELLVDEGERAPVVDLDKIPKVIEVKAGEKIDLPIPFTVKEGTPMPKANWKKDGAPLKPENAKTEMTPKACKLKVGQAKRADSGDYELELANKVGAVKVPIKIKVVDKPSRPEPDLEAFDVYKDRCKLRWKPPKDDGGAPIEEYIVEQMDTARGSWNEVARPKKPEAAVDKLVAGKKYKFRVKAVNKHGESKPLDTPHDILAKDPYDEPDSPGTPEVHDVDENHADISWAPPKDDGGAPLEKYIIEKKEKGGDWVKANEVPAGQQNARVKHLDEGKEYEFRVIAVNKGGNSLPSNASKPVLALPKLRKPRIDKRDLRDVRLKKGQSFTLDVPFTGAPAPDVIWTRNGEVIKADDIVQITNSPTRSIFKNTSGVRKDTGEYKITVKNEAGEDSALINIVVLGPPSRPEGPLEVSDVTKDKCKLKWNPPKDDGGNPIQAYKVEKYDPEYGTWEKVSDFVKGTECTVPKLEEGHDYKFRVSAENQHGYSEPLETEKSTKAKNPYDPPSKPGKPEIVDTNRDHIDIKWAEPKSDGGAPITGYDIERKDPKSDLWRKINSEPVQGTKFHDDKVSPNKEYEYRVIAKNKGGDSEPSEVSRPAVAKPMKEAPKINLDGLFGADEIRVKAGEPFTIPVGISGAPAPTVAWKKNGKDLVPNNRVQMNNDEENAKLHVPVSKRDDSGKYTIAVDNPNGADSKDIKVVVLDKPGAPEGPLNVSDVTADSAKLTWKEPEDDGGAELTGYIVEKMEEGSGFWEKVPGIITPDKTSKTVDDLVEGKKYKFRVKAENMYGKSPALETTKDTLAKHPFDPPGAPRNLEIGKYNRSSVTLNWKEPNDDGGNPIKGYQVEKRRKGRSDWEKAGPIGGPKTTYDVIGLTENETLEFRVAAVNNAGPGAFTKATDPHVVRDPIFAAGAPSTPNIDKLTKKDAKLSWEKPKDDGGSKILGYQVEKKQKDGEWEPAVEVPADELTATVPRLKEGEEYQFRVAAINKLGPGDPSRPTKPVIAENQPERPEIDTSNLPKEITVRAGQDFKIEMPHKGFPKPTSEWTRNGEPVKESPREKIEVTDDKAILKVTKAKRGDTGPYKVKLKNASGEGTAEVQVNVLDAPGAPQGPLNVEDMNADSCTLSWKPPKDDGGGKVTNYIVEKKPKNSDRWTKVTAFAKGTSAPVKNLVEGTEYDFRVMAENEYGIGEPLQTDTSVMCKPPYDPPGAPGKPECKGTTPDSISLRWDPPRSDGGSPITGYVVEKREKGDKRGWTKATVSPILDPEITVPNLIEGHEYEFRVAAVNKAGPGDWSDDSGRIKAQPPPSAPKVGRDWNGKDIIAIAGQPFQISVPYTGSPMPNVTWENGSKPVPDDDRVQSEVTPDKINLNVKKAVREDAGAYTLTMKNDLGSDNLTLKVHVMDKPGNPEGPLEVSNITPDSCKLSWKPPLDNGGSPVENYVVEKMDTNTGKWSPCSKFVRGTDYEVYGLDEGHQYKFRVAATNQYGTSEPLETEKPITAQNQFGVPDAPSDLEVEDVDADNIKLRWRKPKNDGGDKIQGYQVEFKPEGSSRWKPANDFIVRDTRYTVDGLDKGKKYDFRVRAKNGAGLSEPSMATGPVEAKPKYTGAGAPGTPVVKDVGKTYVGLEWTPPLKDGGSKVTGYEVQKRPKGDTNWVKASDFPVHDTSTTLTNLPEGSEYEFRVVPINKAGLGTPSEPTPLTKVKEKLAGSKPEIIGKPHNATGPTKGDVKFECSFVGKPKPDVKWYQNGMLIYHGGRFKINDDEDDKSVLTIRDLEESDAGEITCELANKLGKDSASCKLQVQAPPKIGKELGAQKVNEGDQFKLKVPFSGKGPFSVKLKKGNRDVPENDRIKITPFDDYVLVQLKDADREDGGPYKLEISNDSGTGTAPFQLSVKAKPGPPTGPLDVSDITKSTCSLAWKPPKDDGGSKILHYIVERQEVGKPYWTTVSSFCKDTNCDVQGLYEDKEYLFRVAAVNENGEGTWLDAPNSIIAKLPFDAPGQPGDPTVTGVGGNFVSLEWEKPKSDGGGRIKGYFIEKRDAGAENWNRVNMNPHPAPIFNVSNLIEDREYEFRVFAVNEAGVSKPSMASRTVKVKDPNAATLPEFRNGMETCMASEGRIAKFEVEVDGQPPPTITWFKGTRELFEDDPKFDISHSGNTYMLVVKDVFGEDADEYVCKATNRAGSRSSRADLIIKSPPKIKVPPRFQDVATYEKGEEVVLKIPFTGNPKPTVKWIRDGEDLSGGKYKIEVTDRHAFLTIRKSEKADEGPYRLQLENDLGEDHAIIKIQINDRPDPPRFLVAETIRDDSVFLTWKHPLNDGGSFITEYIVEKREPPKETWSRQCSTRFTHLNIEGLTPNTEYEFRILAENFYGRSDPCEATGVIKTEESGVKKRKGAEYDADGRRIRGKYDGPKIDNYDKLYYDLWKKYKPQPVTIKQGSVYDYYDIYEELGTGAFGAVHRCVEKSTGNTFVAKFINTPYPLDKNTVRNEINIMNQLHHPKLLNLHDAFDDKYEMVLILEFLSGGELFDRVAAPDYKMSEAEVIHYIRQVCDGLKHMHENNIIHLDIKPENVMCDTNKSTNVKLIDFGLAAKLNPDEIVKVTTATAEFAAPEIVDREPVGFYTDMWAVGVLSYVLLSGLSPFAGEDDLETLQHVKRCDWEFDPDAFKNISEEGKDFIKKLLVRQPGRRITVHECLEHPWLLGDHSNLNTRIPSSRYDRIRQKIKEKYEDWPKPMPAIGRIANFSSLRRNRPKENQIHDSYFDRRECIPRFIRKPKNCLVQEGQIAEFNCKIIAASAPLITWMRNDIGLSQSVKYMQKYRGSEYTLRVSRVHMEDKGEYIVKAENSYGKRECAAFLNVEPAPEKTVSRASSLEPLVRRKRILPEIEDFKPAPDTTPRFNFGLRERIIQEGIGVKLICCVEAKPVPTITWYFNNKEIRNSSSYTIQYSTGVASLEIMACELSDAGKYTCIAENAKGTEESSCRVVVEESLKRRPEGLSNLPSITSSHSRTSRRTTESSAGGRRTRTETTETTTSSSTTSS
ncbi:unnamed protein product [Owenia fusiformis]|uniref:non-specific serine/threonine protein kinase n=1 Tax=Owenia fusiformis TaxID=6347 RepID=A0A8J1Y2N7_OWEFU|nr:unnamed protein product [Owenia fusiformis]